MSKKHMRGADAPEAANEAVPAEPSPNTDPPPELIDALVRYYTNKRTELEQQIRDMESLLGFIEISADLAVRVARLEKFVKG